MRNTQTSSKKKAVAFIIAVIALLALGYFSYAYSTKSIWPFQKTQDTPSGMINYNPPTQAEIDSSQDAKGRITDQEDQTKNSDQTNASTKKSVVVNISYADIIDGKLEIRAFTGDVISGEGTCTATVKKDSVTITKQSASFVDATSTICEPIYIGQSRLTSGTWNITVKYDSPTHNGTSGSIKVNVR